LQTKPELNEQQQKDKKTKRKITQGEHIRNRETGGAPPCSRT